MSGINGGEDGILGAGYCIGLTGTGLEYFFDLDNMQGTINQLCRFSPHLIEKTLALREKHGRFCFHELQFASIARAHGMNVTLHERDDVLLRALPLRVSQSSRQELTDAEYIVVHPVKKWYDS